jgi:hypothetical protein
MKIKLFALSLFLFPSAGIAQFKPLPIESIRIDWYVPIGGGVTLGLAPVGVTVTGLGYDSTVNIYRIEGYINEGHEMNDTNKFEIVVIDSSLMLKDGIPWEEQYDKKISYKYEVNRYGLFTLFLKPNECADVISAYPVRIQILPLPARVCNSRRDSKND